MSTSGLLPFSFSPATPVLSGQSAFRVASRFAARLAYALTRSNRGFSLAAMLSVGAAVGQVPLDYAITVESRTTATSPTFMLHRLPGGGSARCRNQSVFTAFTSVSVDPNNSQNVFALNNYVSFPGPFELTLQDSRFGRGVWGNYKAAVGSRLEIGTKNVFFLDETGLRAVARPGNQSARTLIAMKYAVDLAVDGRYVYVAADGLTPQPLRRYDLQSKTAQVIGRYANILSVAADRGRVWIGDRSGRIFELDPSTGRVRQTIVANRGPVNSLGLLRDGTPVFSTGAALWSTADLSRARYVAESTILDFDLGRSPASSVLRFGTGCRGSGGAPTISVVGRPVVPAPQFAFGLRAGAPNSAAILNVGTDRFGRGSSRLPFDLGPLGAPGCRLLVAPGILVAVPTAADGSARLAVPLPNDPTLRGAALDAQWYSIDLIANRLGIVVSDGIELTIG